MKMSAEDAAAAAGLCYVHDQMPGIKRQPWGQGFSYVLPTGDRLATSPPKGSPEWKMRERIENLTIPPQWSDVWICLNPQGHLQATGRDRKGRKQYRYHPDWRTFRNLKKFDRMVPFGERLPILREQTTADLQLKKLSRRKVTAAAVQLLDRTLIRIGNTQYAKKNKSYGLTTLRDRHVKISEPAVTFQFIGKSGIEHEIELEDPKLARIIRRCRDIPGYELFQYYDTDGHKQTLESGDVNDYLKSVTGEPFTAKDFRTWAGTAVATHTLEKIGDWTQEKEAKNNIATAIETTAKQLGNQPATCRKYYIHPIVPKNYLTGSLIKQLAEAKKQTQPTNYKTWLEQHEQTVLSLLKITN